MRSIKNALLSAMYVKRFVVLRPKFCNNNIYMVKKRLEKEETVSFAQVRVATDTRALFAKHSYMYEYIFFIYEM